MASTLYSVTAANVLQSANATLEYGIAGVALTRGQAVYQVPADLTWKLADADGAMPLPKMAGVVMNDVAAGQPVTICTGDPNFKPGFTLTVGEVAILSDTAGSFCLFSDYTTGWYLAIAYVGIGSNFARFTIIRTDVIKP